MTSVRSDVPAKRAPGGGADHGPPQADAAPHGAASAVAAGWQAYCRSTLALGLTGSLLLFAAVQPLEWSWLAWVAPLPWLVLVERRQLAGWPYRTLWLAGFAFWMATLHWLRLPHWATSFGWIALSAYLAVYLPLFVGLSRVAVHTWKVSVVVAAPVVWTGLELARGHVLGGFTMAGLGHTQYRFLEFIQIADLVGAYGVGFAVMFVVACAARMLPVEGRKLAWWPLLPLAAMLGGVLAYGAARRGDVTAAAESGQEQLRVALIQGQIPTTLKRDPGEWVQVLDHYVEVTDQALLEHGDVDLIVWPETMFPKALVTLGPDPTLPDETNATLEQVHEHQTNTNSLLVDLARRYGKDFLMGIEVHHFNAGRRLRYNSALLIDGEGRFDVESRYDKLHLVMFGEYVPAAEYIPWLYRLTPLSSGLEAGDHYHGFETGGFVLAPSVCYESVVPHVIRSSVLELRAAGREPDALVNLTNDGWFWGSSQLPMHLVCGVFRAVECRKPMLISANTGISAWIDSEGQIVSRAPTFKQGYVIAEIGHNRTSSFYLEHGDVFAGGCLLACGALAVTGWFSRRRSAG